MTTPVALAPDPDLTTFRQMWVDPFDETPVFARLSYWTRKAPCGTQVPGFRMVPDVTVATRRDVPEDGSPAAEAVLTADGRGARYDAWCESPGDGESWVYYERWTAEFARHGFVCRDCRRLTQTG
jgi:hypothetical protein